MAFPFEEHDLTALLHHGVTPGQLTKDESQQHDPSSSTRYAHLEKAHEDSSTNYGLFMTERLGAMREKLQKKGTEDEKMMFSGIMMTVQQTRLIYLLTQMRRYCPNALNAYLGKGDDKKANKNPTDITFGKMIGEFFRTGISTDAEEKELKEDLRQHCEMLEHDLEEQQGETRHVLSSNNGSANNQSKTTTEEIPPPFGSTIIEDAWYAFNGLLFGGKPSENKFMTHSSATAAKRAFEDVYLPTVNKKGASSSSSTEDFRVLDIGCGGGFFGEELQKLVDASSNSRHVVIHGLDSSPSGLGLLQSRLSEGAMRSSAKVDLYSELKMVNVNDLRSNAEEEGPSAAAGGRFGFSNMMLGSASATSSASARGGKSAPKDYFPEQSYDLVVSADVLMQAPVHGFPGPQALTEVWKWVKPGGALVCSNSLAFTPPGFLGFYMDALSSPTAHQSRRTMMSSVREVRTQLDRETIPFVRSIFTHLWWKKE